MTKKKVATKATKATKEPTTDEMTCQWVYDAGANYYATACHRSWAFTPGNGPKEAAWRVCPFCGKLLEIGS
jgi:hypothetical protein